jgi:hypothetical protein
MRHKRGEEKLTTVKSGLLQPPVLHQVCDRDASCVSVRLGGLIPNL